ncbi:MAG: flippase-like domain-containing protein [Gemmatimonadota bacterium]|nr:flippase-like domain-containing protein [Gemmatimonadota bacterium]
MKLDWRSALGIALSAFFLWLTLRGVQFHEVWLVLRHSNLLLFAASTVVATSIFPLRARRWQPILEPVAGQIPFVLLWRATAIGMAVNNVLPLRAGEVARAFALTRQVPRVALTTALSSLAVDRLFDAIVLLTMMFGAMLDPAFPSGVTIQGLTIPQMAATGVSLMFVVLLGCYAIVLQPERISALVSRIAHRLFPRFENSLVRLFGHVAGGLAVLKDSRRFAAVLFWTVLHWLTHALGLYLGFLAVGISVPFSAALFLQGILGIGVAVPSSPGFVGVFEGAAKVGLAVYAIPATLAVSWAIGYHVLSFIPITVMGMWYFARLRLGLSDLRGAAVNKAGAV